MKHKKVILSALTAAILLLCLLPVPALAAEGATGTDGYYDWQELSDGTVTITAYWGPDSGGLDIPDKLSAKTVTAINANAFFAKDITSVKIPASVKTIGSHAFFGCDSLNSVTFAENSCLETIGEYAFCYTALTSVTIPASVKTIGSYAFTDFGRSSRLNTVTFAANSSLETIGVRAFSDTALTSVTIPASVKTIGDSAFYACSSLNTVAFAANGSLETIGNYAFTNTALTSVTIPASVKTISSYAFYYCFSLNTVAFAADGSLETIGDYAFSDTALTSVTIPASVKTIGDCAFAVCTSLNTAAFAADGSLETIGEYAFAYTALTGVTIPASVKTIGSNAFYECASLNTAVFAANGSLETIGESAFSDTALTSVTIPASVKTIGDYAFQYSLLNQAVLLNESISLGYDVFFLAPMAGGIYGFGDSSTEQYASDYGFEFHELFKVVYDSKGGSAVHFGGNISGGTVDAPDDPTLSGNIFAGWYKNDDYTGDPVSFPYTVTDNVTLYAKWTLVCTVTFESNGGSAVASQQVTAGNKAAKPADPTLAGSVFMGWYADAALTDEWDFNTDTVSADTTLHAKWTALTLASSDADGRIYTGGRVTLTPSISGGSWSFDSTYLSRSGNTFTGLKAGATTVTYTAGQQSKSFAVTIRQSGVPDTGQDFTWAWLTAAGAMLVFAAALALTFRKRAAHG